MRRLIPALMIMTALVAGSAEALNSGDDVLVPAVGRNKLWTTDMYVMNFGNQTVDVTVYWLERNQANPTSTAPQINFSLAPDETEVLDDLIFNEFAFDIAFGAFRVVATGEVIVNTRVYSTDVEGATSGQQSEGIPLWAATQAGQSTNVVGFSKSSDFRSNIYVQAGPNGAEIDFSLLDPNAMILGTASLSLDELEPYLEPVQILFDQVGNFPDATMRATVTSGSAVIGGSKVDEDSDDPTTLESRTAGGPLGGTYQISIYDSALLAAGGQIVIEDGLVVQILGTYFNYDKVDGSLNAECAWILGLGDDYTASATSEPWQSFLPAAGGYTFDDTYLNDDDSVFGKMTWTLTFDIDDNMDMTGTVDAVGSQWTGEDAGCNGTFPQLDMRGGKAN